VDDVSADERYLQCFLNTKSEIVVPIKQGDIVYGEIDVDGDQLAAFGPADQQFLATLCDELAAAIVTTRGQTLSTVVLARHSPTEKQSLG